MVHCILRSPAPLVCRPHPRTHSVIYTVKMSICPQIFCGEFSVFYGIGSVAYTFVFVNQRNNEARAHVSVDIRIFFTAYIVYDVTNTVPLKSARCYRQWHCCGSVESPWPIYRRTTSSTKPEVLPITTPPEEDREEVINKHKVCCCSSRSCMVSIFQSFNTLLQSILLSNRSRLVLLNVYFMPNFIPLSIRLKEWSTLLMDQVPVIFSTYSSVLFSVFAVCTTKVVTMMNRCTDRHIVKHIARK